MQEEVARVDSNIDNEAVDPQVFDLAVKEVKQCLRLAGNSLLEICNDIENATSRSVIKAVFRRLNSVTRFFLRLAPVERYDALISRALCELDASPRLQTFLRSANSV